MRYDSCLEEAHTPRREEKNYMQEITKAKYKPYII